MKNAVLYMQAGPLTGSESIVWKRGGSLQALCLQSDESRLAGIQSRAPTVGDKAAETAERWPTHKDQVNLTAQHWESNAVQGTLAGWKGGSFWD